jgi:hypothetical protein
VEHFTRSKGFDQPPACSGDQAEFVQLGINLVGPDVIHGVVGIQYRMCQVSGIGGAALPGQNLNTSLLLRLDQGHQFHSEGECLSLIRQPQLGIRLCQQTFPGQPMGHQPKQQVSGLDRNRSRLLLKVTQHRRNQRVYCHSSPAEFKGIEARSGQLFQDILLRCDLGAILNGRKPDDIANPGGWNDEE